MNEIVAPQGAQQIRPQPSEDFNKLIQELTQMKHEIDLYLQGITEYSDENGKIQSFQSETPRINEKGRREVMAWVQIYINPNVYLAENKEHNVSANYSLDQANLADILSKNLQEYELSIENAIAIHAKVSNMMFHALQRSVTDKKYIFPQIKTDYGNPQMQMPEQKKWFGLF